MADNNTLHVEVVTAERELYNGEAEAVNAPGSEGRLGILPRHAPLLAFLKAGELRIDLQGAEDSLFVSGGFLEVYDNTVTVLADSAEHAEEIDQARAEEARRRAQELLAEVHDDQERAELQGSLQRAINRLRVAEMASRRGRRRIESSRNYDQE
jgi:F-type H+-transporting ATPase subunit epsilon